MRVAGKSPIYWYGGKGKLRRRILRYLPARYRIYCEVFGGAAHLLFTMPARKDVLEVYNDLDGDLAAFFRVLRDDAAFRRLMGRMEVTEYGVSVLEEALAKLRSGTWEDEVDRAWCFFVMNSMSMNPPSDRFARRRDVARTVSETEGRLRRLGLAHERVRRLVVENLDFRKLIPFYDGPETFFYCDPPYVLSTRRTLDVYRHEMSDEDHRELVSLLLNVRGMVMVSGYDHPIYSVLESHGWRRAELDVRCHAEVRVGEPRSMRVEVLWMNYDPPVQLPLLPEACL